MAQQYGNQFNQDVQRRGISNQEMMQQRQDPYNQLGQLLGFSRTGRAIPHSGRRSSSAPWGWITWASRISISSSSSRTNLTGAAYKQGGAQAAMPRSQTAG